jgi:hypothetical protein
MTLAISPFGDEHDKDIALAIRYAIDNGAKVINMSFCKEFSLHRKWVNDAFKYAKKNNVIIIAAAGNEAQNLNSVSIRFPNDILNNVLFVREHALMIALNKVNDLGGWYSQPPCQKIFHARFFSNNK